MRPIREKPSRQDAHEFIWKMYCVPNSARQSMKALFVRIIKTADKLRGGAYLPKMRGSITKFINTMGEWYL